MPSPYLLLEEVAEETRSPVSTVRHWIATKRLASVRPGRRRLVHRADLAAFLGTARADNGDPSGPIPSDRGRAIEVRQGLRP